MNQNGRRKWHITHPLGGGLYIMTCNEDGKLRHALLYIHTFRLMAPRKLLEAQLFNKQYGCYEDIDNIPDRLRFCRHRLGLMQKEVARMAGITRNTYINLETGNLNSFNKTTADKPNGSKNTGHPTAWDRSFSPGRWASPSAACRIGRAAER